MEHIHIQTRRMENTAGGNVVNELSADNSIKLDSLSFSAITQNSKRGDCLIFHTRNSLLFSLPFLSFNRLMRRNVIAYQPHTNLRPTLPNKLFLAFFTNKIIFLTKTNKTQWGKLGEKYGVVIPNPVPLKRLKMHAPSKTKKEYDFVWAGRNAPCKRLEIFINAIKGAEKTNGLLLTDRIDPEKLKLLEGAEGRITLMEGKQKSDFFKEFSKGKVFVFTSTDEEGFGIILLEALFLKLPIIAPDLPKFREILKGKAIYWENEDELCKILRSIKQGELDPKPLPKEILDYYLPDKIRMMYESI